MSLDQLSQARWSPFSLRESQLAWASRYHLAGRGEINLPRVIGVALAVTWLPLAVLTVAEGAAFAGSVEIPFFRDYVPHGRYLLAVPLLLLMDQVVERRTSRAIAHLRSSGLVAPGDANTLDDALAAIAKAWRSRWVRWTIVAFTYAIAVATFIWGRQLDLSNWVLRADTGQLSVAGSWQLFISAPLARLLVLRALWKLAVWVWLLARLSRLRLHIDPLHPDQRCGLRFLGETQVAFVPLVAALGVQLGCVVADAVQFQQMTLSSFKLVGVAFVVLSVLLLLGPLLIFARRGWLAIERAEDAFSIWGSLAARHISAQLVKSQREHDMAHLSTSEISSMTDAAALFDRVLATRSLPVDTRQIALVVVVAVGAMLLPLLGLLPLADILQRLAKILL
jgi:hypothetical protein